MSVTGSGHGQNDGGDGDRDCGQVSAVPRERLTVVHLCLLLPPDLPSLPVQTDTLDMNEISIKYLSKTEKKTKKCVVLCDCDSLSLIGLITAGLLQSLPQYSVWNGTERSELYS